VEPARTLAYATGRLFATQVVENKESVRNRTLYRAIGFRMPTVEFCNTANSHTRPTEALP